VGWEYGQRVLANESASFPGSPARPGTHSKLKSYTGGERVGKVGEICRLFFNETICRSLEFTVDLLLEYATLHCIV